MQWMKVVNYMHSAQDSTAFLKWCNFFYFFWGGGDQLFKALWHYMVCNDSVFFCFLLVIIIFYWKVVGVWGIWKNFFCLLLLGDIY